MGKSNVDTSDNVLSSDFAAWLRIHRVAAHGIQAAFVAEGWRGIAATEDISAGAPLIEAQSSIDPCRSSRTCSFRACSKLRCDSNLRPDLLLPGALLLQVPEEILMTTNSAAREEDFNTASKRECDLSPEQARLLHASSCTAPAMHA